MPSISVTTVLAIIAYAAASAIPSDSLLQRDLKTCPALDGYVWTSPSGATTWKIGCNKDTYDTNGHAVETIEAESLENCIKVCGGSSHKNWCLSVSYPGNVNERGPCYLKGSGKGDIYYRNGWKVAYKL